MKNNKIINKKTVVIDTKRNITFDIIKGMLMILVIIGHLQFFEYNSRTLTLIYSFHMPAFLIISGYFSYVDNKTAIISTIKNKFTNILVPYFVFYFVSLLLIPTDGIKKQSMAIVTIFKGIGDPIYAINLPLWFLTFYFSATITYEILEIISYRIYNIKKLNKITEENVATTTKKYYIIKNIFQLIFIFLLMAISYYYAKIIKGQRLPFNIEIACFCLLFIYIGKIFKYIETKITTTKSKLLLNKNNSILFYSITTIVFIIISILWYKISMQNGRIDLNARDYKNALFMYIDAVLGFIILYFVANVINKINIASKTLAYIGKNSIYILAYHIPSSIITHNIIIPLMPKFLIKYLYTNNIISICFFTLCSILFSLFMMCLHKVIDIPRSKTNNLL